MSNITKGKLAAWAVSVAIVAGIVIALAYGFNLKFNGSTMSPATVCDIEGICRVSLMVFMGQYLLNMVAFIGLGMGIGILFAKALVPRMRRKSPKAEPVKQPITLPQQPQQEPKKRPIYRY